MPIPAVSRDMLMIGLRQMVSRAFNRPELRNRHVRQVTLRALLEGDRRSWERTLTLKEPCGQDRVINALRLRLQDLEMQGPVEFLTIELSGIVGETARQAPPSPSWARATSPPSPPPSTSSSIATASHPSTTSWRLNHGPAFPNAGTP